MLHKWDLSFSRRVIVRARFTAGNTVMLRAHHFAASA